MKSKKEPFVVRRPLFKTTKLVDEKNEYHQSMNTVNSIQQAERVGLDLVCFDEGNRDELPLCKILDYSKWKYLQKKQEKKQRNLQKNETKEIRFGPLISENDIQHKLKHAKEFLEEGNEVIFSMRLKGRQRSHFAEALVKMESIVLMCETGQEVSRKNSPTVITTRLAKRKETIV